MKDNTIVYHVRLTWTHDSLAATFAAVILLVCGISTEAEAQNYLPQKHLEELVKPKAASLEAIPSVEYGYYIVKKDSRLMARLTLYHTIGKEHSNVIRLLNRSMLRDLQPGDTLVIPSAFEIDWRAYSPFPLRYPGARNFDKLVVLDKTLQVFAAYANGKLVRWGLANTGQESAATPNGRFNFNWKAEQRRSSINRNWKMHWVINFHYLRGIHIHQYALPTGGPASHGCVRILNHDAKWLYHWVDTWNRDEQGNITDQGTTFLVIGDESDYKPRLFKYTPMQPVLRKVSLPADPMDVPPGSPQQKRFDQMRAEKVDR